MMGGGARRTGRRRGHRKPGRREIKKRILVVGEGEQTEYNYFDSLRREERVCANFIINVRKGPGRSPDSVVKETLALIRGEKRRGKEYEYDEVWCVLDVETQATRESLERARRMADEHEIKLCLSNPSIEVWFLAHFERSSRAFNNADAVIDTLNSHWQSQFDCGYDKSDNRLYEKLAPFMDKAMTNARTVREDDHCDKLDTADANSSTDIYRFVSRLLGHE